MNAGASIVAKDLAMLMAAAQAGDRIAYESVLMDSVALIRATALACDVPAKVIDGIVQATLLTVHGVRHTYDPAHSYIHWLDAIARQHVRRSPCSIIRGKGSRGAPE